MSYKTNSTANRFNINKGWKNPSFPETLTFYSRDNVFFFKLYLFLKAYFTLKKIRLIYCEVRLSANYTKLLYLVINTVPKKKWKKKIHTLQFTKRRSGMKYSLLRKGSVELSKNLLFFDLNQLKNQFKNRLLPLSKQKINPLLYTKPRRKSAINYLKLLNKTRLAPKLKYKQKLTKFAPTYLNKLTTQQILNKKFAQIKKEILLFSNLFNLLKTKNLLNKQNLKFYKETLITLQKKFENLNKSNKKTLNIKKSYKVIHTKKSKNASLMLKLYKTWFARKNLAQLKKNEFLLKKKLNKGTQLYKQSLNYIKYAKKPRLSKFNSVILNDNRHKTLIYKLLSSYITYSKATNTINTERSFTKFLRLVNMQYILQHNLQSNQNFEHFTVSNNKKKLKKKLISYPLSKKKFNVVRRSKQTITPYAFQTLKFLRQNKKKLYCTRSSSNIRINTVIKNKLTFSLLQDLKKNYKKEHKRIKKTKTKTIWKLRQAFRKTYKNHVNTLTRYQYKLGLQSILQKFFSTKLELKFVQPLSKFKNLKFLRLIYSNHRQYKRKNSKTMNYKANKQVLKRKKSKKGVNIENDFTPVKLRYIYVGNRAKRYNGWVHKGRLTQSWVTQDWVTKNRNINIDERIEFVKLKAFDRKTFKRRVFNLKAFKLNCITKFTRKFIRKLTKKVTRKLTKKVTRRFNKKSYIKSKQFLRKNRINLKKLELKKIKSKKIKSKKLKPKKRIKRKNTYIFKKKTDVFKRLRKKQLLEFTKTRLQSVKRQLLMHTLTPILSLCVKYINPQILADHIAKEFEKTKKHRSIIFSLSTALRSLNLSRAMGYRIAIVGRINSADKSRAYYLTRKVLVRQNFANKVNFASAQARARIGSFGIKVWMFY